MDGCGYINAPKKLKKNRISLKIEGGSNGNFRSAAFSFIDTNSHETKIEA